MGKLYGTFQIPTYENTSVLVARVVLKSSLAQRIAGARKHKEDKALPVKVDVERVTLILEQNTSKMTRREAITAKFLANEKEWKKDAVQDADRRIAQGISSLGI